MYYALMLVRQLMRLLTLRAAQKSLPITAVQAFGRKIPLLRITPLLFIQLGQSLCNIWDLVCESDIFFTFSALVKRQRIWG